MNQVHHIVMEGDFKDFSLTEVLEVASLSRQLIRIVLSDTSDTQKSILMKSGQILEVNQATTSQQGIFAFQTLLKETFEHFKILRLKHKSVFTQPLGTLIDLLNHPPILLPQKEEKTRVQIGIPSLPSPPKMPFTSKSASQSSPFPSPLKSNPLPPSIQRMTAQEPTSLLTASQVSTPDPTPPVPKPSYLQERNTASIAEGYVASSDDETSVFDIDESINLSLSEAQYSQADSFSGEHQIELGGQTRSFEMDDLKLASLMANMSEEHQNLKKMLSTLHQELQKTLIESLKETSRTLESQAYASPNSQSNQQDFARLNQKIDILYQELQKLTQYIHLQNQSSTSSPEELQGMLNTLAQHLQTLQTHSLPSSSLHSPALETIQNQVQHLLNQSSSQFDPQLLMELIKKDEEKRWSSLSPMMIISLVIQVISLGLISFILAKLLS